MLTIAEKGFLRKKFKKHSLTSIQKSISVQTNRSTFVDRVEEAKSTKFEPDLMKTPDCFSDSYGSYECNVVSFKEKLAINLSSGNTTRSWGQKIF